LEEDLNLGPDHYNTAVMILSLGYVLGQIPSNMITGYLRPSLYLCLMAVVWSGVSVAMCGTKDFTGLVLVRFFLGVVEAPLLPGAVYLMGCWYTRWEMAMRVAILYTGQTLAYCASGLIAAAVLLQKERRPSLPAGFHLDDGLRFGCDRCDDELEIPPQASEQETLRELADRRHGVSAVCHVRENSRFDKTRER
jgi:MFS family permease